MIARCKLLKSLTVRLASLNLPGGWEKKLDKEDVDGLVDELKEGALLPPIRLDSGRYVVQGFHRVAAHQALGLKEIRAEIVEYATPVGRKKDVLAENLRRRQISTEEYRAGLREMVKLFEAEPEDREAIEDQLDAEMGGAPAPAGDFSSPDDQLPPPSSVGRPKSAKRQAIKKTAQLTGASESTVERAIKEPDEEPEAPTPTEIPACLDWFDLEPDRDIDGQARKVQAQVDEGDKQLRSVRRLLTGLRELGLANAVCDQLEADYDKLAHGLRRSRPKSACLYCKPTRGGGIRKDCYACGGLGWFTHHQYDGDLPGELRQRGEKAMVADGAGGYRLVLADKPEPYKPIAAVEDETPEGDPSTPYEPKPGDLIELQWAGKGETKRARFVRFTKRGSVVAQVARVNAKGKYTGEFGSEERTFNRAELLGPVAEGLPF